MKHNLASNVVFSQRGDLLVVDNSRGNVVEFKDLSADLFLKIAKGADDKQCMDFLMHSGAQSALVARRLYNSMIYTLSSLKMLSEDRSIFVHNAKVNIATAMIEITNGCNFRCPHCYVDKSKTKTLSLGKVKNIIDELYDLNASRLLFTGGEVLTHKDFFKMYLYAYKKGFIVSINTNGSLITDEALRVLKKYPPFTVEISVYGYNETTYKNFTRCENQYEKVVENIKKLKNENINVVCKCVFTNSNSKFFDKIKEQCEGMGVKFYSDYLTFPQLNGGFKQNDEQVSAKKAIDFIKQNPYTEQHYLRLYSSFKQTSQCVFQCRLRDDAIFINSRSMVNVCPCMQSISYKYRKGGLLSCVLKLKELADMQMAESAKCRNCPLLPLCRYCPAKFYLATGDYQTPPSWYCDFAGEVYKNFVAGTRVIKTQYPTEFEIKALEQLGFAKLKHCQGNNLIFEIVYIDGKIGAYAVKAENGKIIALNSGQIKKEVFDGLI